LWLKRSNFVLVDADANTLLSIQVRTAVPTAMNGTIVMTMIWRRKNGKNDARGRGISEAIQDLMKQSVK